MQQTESIKELLDRLAALGERLEKSAVQFDPPASAEAIAELERDAGGDLPADLREYLQIRGSGYLAGLELNHSGLFVDEGLFSIHGWGNGDFDGVVLSGGKHPKGSVVFANHNPDTTVVVAASRTDWLRGVISELTTSGGLAHPMDYMTGAAKEGMYSHVPKALAGVDCELNR